MSQRIRFHSAGDPVDVAQLEDYEEPQSTNAEVRLRFLAAPINPADINYLQGVYGIKPELPATAGFEGCAQIESAPEDSGLTPGQLVIPIKSIPTWQEVAVCSPENVAGLPEGIDPLQAAMLSVNPMTALRLLTDFAELKTGDWILQNAANSAVGTCVIQIAKQLGLKTANVVRREGAKEPLVDLGADAVFVESPKLASDLKEHIGKGRAPLALNAVGGESALALAKALSPQGTHVTYGAMARRPLTLPNGLLIFKRIHFCGFWVTRWIDEAPLETIRDDYRKLAQWVRDGLLNMPVEKTYSLSEYKIALEYAQKDQRSGKILFKLADPL
ncbi:MAG: 2-enoyl thioester reductase domain-containing protein [Verrucomicrobiota bacterium]